MATQAAGEYIGAMRFSLVVATLGRTAEPIRLLESLQRQSHRDFEVIVVDQNDDDRLVPILKQFSVHLDLRHLQAEPGVSRARNLGLRVATGEVVCFPDDDCWYGDDLLRQVDQGLAENPEWDGVIGDTVDAAGKPTLPWRDRRGELSLAMCWRRAVTYVYFLRSHVLQRTGGFDELIGPGSGTAWASGEDNDLLLRVLKAGYQIQYEPAIRVHHPDMYVAFDRAGRDKRYRYAIGGGLLLRKHPMPLWWVALFFAVPAARVILAAVKFRGEEMSCHWAALRGRAHGYFARGNAHNSEQAPRS